MIKSKTAVCVSISLAIAISVFSPVADSYLVSPQSANTTIVANLPDRSFSESPYYAAALNGGSITREKNFVRGIGSDAWHTTEGWNLSDKTKALDRQLLAELRVNSYRTWGTISDGEVQNYINNGTTVMPTAHTSDYIKSVSTTGESGGISFVDATTNAFVAKARNALSAITHIDGIESYLLGNEYTNFDSQYAYCGYDNNNLNIFRNVWLKERFGTIANFKAKMGITTSFSTLADYYAIKDWNDIPSPAVNSGKKYATALFSEFYLFIQTQFETLMQSAYNAAKAVNPEVKLGYAKLFGTSNMFCDDADLSFMDVGGENIYPAGNNLEAFSYRLQNQLSLSGNGAFYATETGVVNTEQLSDRIYKQIMAMMYMNPKVAGAYAFEYSFPYNDSQAWGIVTPDRQKTKNFYALKQLYTDFEYLDQYFTGASASPVVALTNSRIGKLYSDCTNLDQINSVLQSYGATTLVVQSDKGENIKQLQTDRLIVAESNLYQNPDGSNDTAAAINSYLDAGNQAITLNPSEKLSTRYGNNSGLSLLKANSALQSETINSADSGAAWSIIAPFLHSEFVAGNVALKENTIDSSAIRILDATVDAGSSISNIEQSLLYKNGHLYLCVNNTGNSEITALNITLGVNNGVSCNLHPVMLAADAAATVCKPQNATVPAWVADSGMTSSIAYGTVTVNNLSTYAFIDLGMAVSSNAGSEPVAAEEKSTKLLFSFDGYPDALKNYVNTTYQTEIDYSQEQTAPSSSVSMKIRSLGTKYPAVTVTTDLKGAFAGTGLSFWHASDGKIASVTLLDSDGNNLNMIPGSFPGISEGGELSVIDYTVIGMNQSQIEAVAAIKIQFSCNEEVSTSYLDDIRILNPYTISNQKDVVYDDSKIYDMFNGGGNNMSAGKITDGIRWTKTAQTEYTSFMLNFNCYCEKASVTFKNSGSSNVVICSYDVIDKAGTSHNNNLYCSVAPGGYFTINANGYNETGISYISVIVQDNSAISGFAFDTVQIKMTAMRFQLTPAVTDINCTNEAMYKQFCGAGNNMSPVVSSGGIRWTKTTQTEYTSFSLNFHCYCDAAKIVFKNSGNNPVVLCSYNVTDQAGNSSQKNIYCTISSNGYYTVNLSGCSRTGLSHITFIVQDATAISGFSFDVTQINVYARRSDRLVAVISKINYLNPFNYADVAAAYNQLSDDEKSYVYNSSEMNKYLPTIDRAEICMRGADKGQLQLQITSPDYDDTAENNSYKLVGTGVVMLPVQKLYGELTAESKGAALNEVIFSNECEKSSYASYKILVSDSDCRPFVRMAIRAYAIYSNGLATVKIYSGENGNNKDLYVGTLNDESRKFADYCLNVCKKETDIYKVGKTDFLTGVSYDAVHKYLMNISDMD